MFKDEKLNNHLQTSATIKTQSLILAEWNFNLANNIAKIGNYRYRPLTSDDRYSTINNSFDFNDEGYFYTNATDADTVVDGGFADDGTPSVFVSKIEKEKILFSLEDCFGKFRPRSGINKVRYFSNKFLHHSNQFMSQRPRYYLSNKLDQFKYWTSYRTENNIERGIAKRIVNGKFYIDDVAPFVVYNDSINVNRIVVKMQTGVGSIDLGPFNSSSGTFQDPFYGAENMSVPNDWKIQVLKGSSWEDIIRFDANSRRLDGSLVIGSDGHVEIYYGLVVPEIYLDYFVGIEEISSDALLPISPRRGSAFLIKNSPTDKGVVHIWTGSQYETFSPTYGWSLFENKINKNQIASTLINSETFIDSADGLQKNREVDSIRGIRIVVESMNKLDSVFDLIEISPRLVADVSDIVTDLSITKSASDLGISGLPVGQLLASTGTLSIFDYQEAFNYLNSNSLLYGAEINTANIKFSIYDTTVNLDGYDYHVPIKTLYSEGFPEIASTSREVSISLRDLFFYLESTTAPEILIQNASLSYAVSLLLDNIGFSNYVFKRNQDEKDPVIQNFFVGPNKSVAEVLNEIAISTQSAMFFDEYNNLVIMTKDYMLPSKEDRETDITLSADSILEMSSEETQVFNNGKISYQERYIQKTYGSIRQASLLDKEKTWVYKPVLLWEVTGNNKTKSVNGEIEQQSSYALSAIPLNSDLSNEIPSVVNHQVVNNVVDLGEGVYWITRNNGYFYANGEILKYDAVQYSVPGINGESNVWIKNEQEYANYFSKLPFNGKIYPTGLIRIYAEPNYETIDGITRAKNGAVAKHGRGQFGTSIVYHNAGLNKYWSDNANVRGILMDSSYIFSNETIPATSTATAGEANEIARKTTRNGVIRNFLSSSSLSESKVNELLSTQSATVQSSALVMNGPSFTTTQSPMDYVSYVYKPLTDRYKHFGTRMRIVGKIENDSVSQQTPVGSAAYYNVIGTSPEKSVNVEGASGGIAVLLNSETNNGYYFEIAALSQYPTDSASQNIYNVMFYKVKRNASATSDSDKAIPIRLWAGLTSILVDDGRFTGQSRIVGEDSPTVYDLAVEYEEIGSARRFYLYINNSIVATVDDEDPLPVYNNMALFIRGSARCMFENIYALANNYSKDSSFAIDSPVSDRFAEDQISANDSFRKFAMSGIVQSTYLSGINPSEPPAYNLYFEEFGTILREAAYFNVKYDKAYPALYAKISPTFNKLKGYSISGFMAGAYGAEFLVFNCTDFALSLDSSSGNYLRIQGITFTQQSNNELTVDDYFNKVSDLSNVSVSSYLEIQSPLVIREMFNDIKNSRFTYGNKDFNIEAPYIQTQDDASSLMGWLVKKVMVPRRSIGMSVFGVPTIQLGDIVEIDYTNPRGNKEVAKPGTRFVVYNIEYTKDDQGPNMNIYVSEVV